MRTSSIVFETRLGWMALVADATTVRHLVLACRTEAEAIAATGLEWTGEAVPLDGSGSSALAKRIRAYAAGQPEEFRDVPVDMGYLTPLGRRVFDRCRRIPYGETRTYGQLAAEAARPGAARAVGQFLASNRTPILVPCHRVVAAGGGLGGFSAPGGIALKKRLLSMESQASTRVGRRPAAGPPDG
jgi:methylated-DNA-[protein]-cysteine S-methyltransferase